MSAATNVPGLLKTGQRYGPICEATPVVWEGRLLLLVNLRPVEAAHPEQHYLELWEADSRRVISRLGVGYSLASAFAWEGVLYVYAARLQQGGWHDVSEFRSCDLVNWSGPRVVISEQPDEQLFNQSVCRAGKSFLMAYESNDPRWPAFTIKFAESDDLDSWRPIPGRIFAPDRYTACPCLRYLDDWCYLLYLEHKRPQWWFETYLVRSRDLEGWEPSPRNPILAPNRHECVNTSDPDLVEFGGKVLLYYSYGDQRTWTELTRAEFAGSLREFFGACYPEGS